MPKARASAMFHVDPGSPPEGVDASIYTDQEGTTFWIWEGPASILRTTAASSRGGCSVYTENHTDAVIDPTEESAAEKMVAAHESKRPADDPLTAAKRLVTAVKSIKRDKRGAPKIAPPNEQIDKEQKEKK